ncbi:MAG TPA: Flp pilus assembly protein CpaB [Gemmataceae bacterium]|nr:Flp pilus assembly protein CpaB [Gemmataceae bacterium]
MKPRTIILLVVAIVCGLAAMYMTNRLLADKGAPPPVATVKVLLTKKKVDAWVPIKKPDDLFEEKEVPAGSYSSKCIADLKQLQDKLLRHSLDEQLPVTPDDLATDATGGLFTKLKPGMRAVAIRVTPESLVGGFVLPESRVDVMFIKKRGDVDSDTQIILQNMLVLAVDQINQRADDKPTMLGTTATLAATPEEAQQLALAQSLGDLRLLLRQPTDDVALKIKPSSIGQLGHQRRSDGDKPVIDDPDTAYNGGSSGGGIPNLLKPEPKPPEVRPAPPVVVETPKTHELEIHNGDDDITFVYVWDKENNRWLKDHAAKTPEAPKSEDAPKSQDAPKPQPPAVPQDKGSVG